MADTGDLFPLDAGTMPALGGSWFIGTSGFQFDDWRGTVYPAHLSGRGLLAHYLNVFAFNALELNFTFYRMPGPRSLASFAQRTPPQYQLAVKAHKDISHSGQGADIGAAAAALDAALEPVRDAGKLAALVVQFPFSFRNTAEHRSRIERIRSLFPNDPLVVEFRHESWSGPETDELLARLGCAQCCVDEPQLKGLMPFRAVATSPLFYARFHGRNAAWFTAGEKERYNYDYSDAELRSLVDRIRPLAGSARKLLVFFNNCYMGRAVKNALRFRELAVMA